MRSQGSTNHLTFDQILQHAELPNPGPEYYEARRRLWLTPRMAPSPRGPSSAREKLEEILSRPNAVHSVNLWNNGLERVWKGLSSGRNLKSRLPMALVTLKIKIIQASWLRDKTWPAGMQAPNSEDEQATVPTPVYNLPSTSSSQLVEISPCIANNYNCNDKWC